MEQIIVEVTVHKANLPVGVSESVQQFTEALRVAGCAHFVKKFGVKEYDVFPQEVYADSAIFKLYACPPDMKSKMYRVPYTRNRDGSFNFGEYKQVIAKTVYEDVAPILGTAGGVAVVKNATAEANHVREDESARPSASSATVRRARPAPPPAPEENN